MRPCCLALLSPDCGHPQPAAWCVSRIDLLHFFPNLSPRSVLHTGSVSSQGAGSFGSLLTPKVPHRPPRASPRLLAWARVLWVYTWRLLLCCTKQRGECQRQSTRQKLISGDISPDSGAVLAISSNSVAPSIKAYCPLMGNLQTEFDFFIKNQQAADEEGSPGFSHLILLLAQA